MKSIDLNCDMGESTASKKIGNDTGIMPFISSANIACGFHAGDPSTMQTTIKLAIDHRVSIGAHPSFYDREGFGRTEMALSAEEIYDMVVFQVGAIQALTKASGHRLHHVKLHGALYNMAARMPGYALAVVRAIKDVDHSLIIYGLSGSQLIRSAKEAGVTACAEVFADRTYQDDGSLTPRSHPGAVIHNVDVSIAQMLRMVNKGEVETLTGKIIPVEADTVCIHGDHPGSAVLAESLHRALIDSGIFIKAPQQHVC